MDIKWTYLLVYSPTVGSYEKVKRFLDTEPGILNWAVYIQHTALIVSDLTAGSLTESFRKKFPKGRFVILDTSTDRNGYLPREAWELMKNPKAVGEQ